ncbi:two-component sensor histidine kinase [Sphaerisporangium siamense]|uniref:histidine kinase n=1 Tax=Sphaerisporangium siamense TaxID=795645 RepID=A0A7W7G8H0_9ACTN|nr:ATP-binding protein [Sphaerisporangium siamense]MBB4699490.1 signal transduction histidine kinase [Sphaerisporangium siamense]GII86903.1 two-component sensor histidine kinase [Sphaerisporangium siamense]
MRRRVIIVFLSLATLTLISLAAPLAVSTARSATQTLVLDRQADTERFAQLAATALASARPEDMAEALRRYGSLFGVDVFVLDRQGEVVATSSDVWRLGPVAAGPARTALSGERAVSAGVVWPWDGEPLVVASPVFEAGEGIGAVLTSSPTRALRSRILDRWTVLLLGALVVMAVALLVLEPITRWILRPVRILHRAVTSIAEGELTARADPYAGPPELRSLAETFNAMGETIERVVVRQRTFVSYASHQLRTPLAVLRLQLEGMAFDHPAAAHDLAAGVEEVDRLTTVCEGLLAFGRVDSDTIMPCVEDVTAVVKDRTSAWRSFAERRGVWLEAEGKDTLVAESGAGVLGQVLDAMLDNAIKFGEPGGTVKVHARAAGGWAEVHVVDDGPGMSPEARRQALEPFWRAAESQNIAGSGLGLTICATLIERVGGEFELLDARPHGLDARVRLRLTAARPDDVPLGTLGAP